MDHCHESPGRSGFWSQQKVTWAGKGVTWGDLSPPPGAGAVKHTTGLIDLDEPRVLAADSICIHEPVTLLARKYCHGRGLGLGDVGATDGWNKRGTQPFPAPQGQPSCPAEAGRHMFQGGHKYGHYRPRTEAQLGDQEGAGPRPRATPIPLR